MRGGEGVSCDVVRRPGLPPVRAASGSRPPQCLTFSGCLLSLDFCLYAPSQVGPGWDVGWGEAVGWGGGVAVVSNSHLLA